VSNREEQARDWRERGYWRAQRLTDYVADWAAATPEATAIIDGDRRWNWATLWESARATARRLVALDCSRGDVVATQLPNGIEMVVLHLACELAGVAHNPLAVQFRQYELDQIGGLLMPRLVVHPGTLRQADYAAIHDATRAGRAGRAVDVSNVVTTTAGADAPSRSTADPWDVAFILNTSGTVAMKGVMHTHEEAMYSTRTVVELLDLGRHDVVICAIPMTWGGGLAWGVRLALTAGAALVSMERWNARDGAELIDRTQASFIYGPPTLARDLVELARDWRPSVRQLTMICAGAPIPRQLVRDARELLGMRLIPGYGQTEHLHSTLGRLDDGVDKITGTDGRALPGVELIAVDEQGERVSTSTPGELICRGPNVALGYANQPDLTAATFGDDGWQVTQDVGAFDEQGYLRVQGRKRDLIIRGGLNVSPREVEELLLKHPAVFEVAVVGMPDERYGERICAFVSPRTGGVAPTLDELAAMLTDMGVARYKFPERIEVLAELPHTTTGKVRHQALRDMLTTGVG
jgi:acyl-CoA synthetase (AMP-forming)/AMP-acid ligase II